MSSTVQLTGMRQLRDNIAKLDKGLQRRVYNKAVKAAGKVVLGEARSRAPVRTGTVKSSIVVRSSSNPSQLLFGVKVSVKGGAKASERTARRRGVGATYHPDAVERYYRFAETGTKHHAAKPFLAPALETKQSQVLSVMKTELSAGLARETRRLPR